jgi:hypothetical protein
MAAKKPKSWPAGRPYLAGDFYSFHTSPATEFSSKETGRYAALKVIAVKDNVLCIAVLDGIFGDHPAMKDVENLPVIRERRFAYQEKPATVFIGADSDNPLEDVKYLGTGVISSPDAELLAGCRSYSAWTWASSVAEGEWRWKNDREPYEHEVKLKNDARTARLVAERKRQKTRLKTLTWENLLEEQPFPRWDRHPAFPPLEFAKAAREQVHSTVRMLQALGPKPKRPQVRKIIKSCVEWFNAKDAEFGGVIETEEREDICAVLEEIAVVARQKTLTSEIDTWRDW